MKRRNGCMLVQEAREGRVGPVIYCDVCRQKITEAADGNAQWIFRGPWSEGSRFEVFFTHKQCCATFDQQHGGEGGVGAEDLSTWLVFLSHALGFDDAVRARAESNAESLFNE